MGRMSALAKRKARGANLPSNSAEATMNRAGGVSFEIKDPAVKLITMCGGSFFMEPRFYNGDACIPARLQSKKGASLKEKFGKLQERLKLAKEKAVKVAACDELDDVSHEIIAAAWDVLSGDNPRDLLAIAHWLRKEMNIRLTPQVLLTIASRHPNGQPFIREYAPKIVVRPDEVKTVLLLHRFFFGMKTIKNCLGNGLSDAVAKFGERGLLKYEGAGFPQWKDVLLWLPRKPGKPLSKPVAEYFMFGKTDKDNTPIAHARKKLAQCKKFNGKAKELVTKSLANWEVVLSQFGQTAESKRDVWEYLIDQNLVGYMALLRNMRNLLEAGVSTATIEKAAARLSDEEQVKRSRQLPFRFAMAKEILEPSPCGHWGWGHSRTPSVREAGGSTRHINKLIDAVETAADIAVENVPELPGKTAVFADNSGSMASPVSERSKVSCLMAANILAGIMAKRSDDALICAFGTDVAEVKWTRRTRVMEFYEKLARADTKGMSTNTHRCVQYMKRVRFNPDRVIILSDMQCWNDSYSDGNFADEWHKFKRGANKNCWLHSVNLNGYGDSMVQEDGDRINLIGAFSEKMINMLLVTEGVQSDALPTLDQIRENW